MDTADILLQTTLFRELQRADVEALLPCVRRRKLARGEALWNDGDRADALWIVAEGQVKSIRLSREGGELILQVAKDGDLVGEVGAFHPSGVRFASVIAMESTVCLTIDRDPLFAFLMRHPPAMRRMLEALSSIAWKAASSWADVAFEDIRARVARTLLDLADETGQASESGVRIPVKLSQTTLAAMVAATRENVNRALATFLSRGEISQRDGFFFVHQRAALEAVAGWPSRP